MSRRSRRTLAGVVLAATALVAIGLNTDLRSPPRYDGAGYSVLGLALSTGRGYREIHLPEAHPHAHFPPGYPLVLAALWSLTGRSVAAAHVLSIACAVTAVWLARRWFGRIEPRRVANLLGLALAVNWTWSLGGGSIQSEPLYLLLSMGVMNLAGLGVSSAGTSSVGREGRRAHGNGSLARSIGLGLLLGACALTRHVGVCLTVAVLLDRASRKRWRDVGVIGLTSALAVAPWVVWLATIRRPTQAGLLRPEGLLPTAASQSLFYLRRLADALSGPYVEVATVFGRSWPVSLAATLAATAVTLVVVIGLIRATWNPRRRLAGLVPLVTLPLLIIWPFTEAGRFLIPLVPFFLVGMVEGLDWLARRFAGGRASHRGQVRVATALLLLLAAIPYSFYALATRRAAAQRATHADFDAACAWIAARAERSGLVLSRHPGEVFWQTGRPSTAPASDDLDALARQIHDGRVAYLLVDPERFANAPPTPLARFVSERPERVRLVHGGAVPVYEVIPDSGP